MSLTSAEAFKHSWKGWIRRCFMALAMLAFALATSAVVVLLFTRETLRREYVPGRPPQGYERIEELYVAHLIGSLHLIDRQPQVPPGVRYEAGVTYARAGGQELKLDLYFPPGHASTDARPILILIHGGGWKSGKREDYRPYANKVAGAGYVVASLSYRLSGAAKFPAQIRDVNAALRFLADRSGRFGIDPQRFVIMGGSAGGHLAMLAAYAADDPDFRPEADPGLESEVSDNPGVKTARIAAVFNFYGPSDLTTEFARSQKVVPELFGGSFEEMSESFRAASPLYRITPMSPPTLVVHGSLDDIVPIQQSDKLSERLHWVRVPVRYERLFGWPHTMDLAQPVFEYLSDVVLEELKKHVGDPVPPIRDGT